MRTYRCKFYMYNHCVCSDSIMRSCCASQYSDGTCSLHPSLKDTVALGFSINQNEECMIQGPQRPGLISLWCIIHLVYLLVQLNITSFLFRPTQTPQQLSPSIPCTTLLHKQSKLDFLLPLQWPGSALRAIRCNASDKLCFSKVLSQGHICWRIYCIIGFSPHVRWVICCVQLRFKKEPEVVLRWWWWEALSAAADTWGETGAPPLYHLCWIHHLSCGK